MVEHVHKESMFECASMGVGGGGEGVQDMKVPFFLNAVVSGLIFTDHLVRLHSVLVLDIPSSVLVLPCRHWFLTPHVTVS